MCLGVFMSLMVTDKAKRGATRAWKVIIRMGADGCSRVGYMIVVTKGWNHEIETELLKGRNTENVF